MFAGKYVFSQLMGLVSSTSFQTIFNRTRQFQETQLQYFKEQNDNQLTLFDL